MILLCISYVLMTIRGKIGLQSKLCSVLISVSDDVGLPSPDNSMQQYRVGTLYKSEGIILLLSSATRTSERRIRLVTCVLRPSVLMNPVSNFWRKINPNPLLRHAFVCFWYQTLDARSTLQQSCKMRHSSGLKSWYLSSAMAEDNPILHCAILVKQLKYHRR